MGAFGALPSLLGLLGVGVAATVYVRLRASPRVSSRARAIADAIAAGAAAFLRREAMPLAAFCAVVAALLWFALGWPSAVAFLTGAGASAAAGVGGMRLATRANLRTAVAAQERGVAAALAAAFAGGAGIGLLVASLGLIGLGALAWWFGLDGAAAGTLQSFAVGASAVALFFRVGGGIFTKSADVAADLVGKLEAGIPEDDPRNPGVIADLVGDNVGDVAGMGADIFESNVGAIVATIAIAATLGLVAIEPLGTRSALMLLPLALASAGLVASLVGIAAVRLSVTRMPAVALRTGTFVAAAAFMAAAGAVTTLLGIAPSVWWSVVAGAIGGVVIGLTTEYFTGGPPVRDLATAGETGPATVLIAGLALGLRSVVAPLVGIGAVILLASHLAGLYGVGIAAVGMLGTVAMVMAIDGFGPVADNAGGIAELAGMGAGTRSTTDVLDALGNTTAAIGKGFAIGAAALAALTMLAAYTQTLRASLPDFALSLVDPRVLAGMLVGGAVPFVVASITMTAVGEAAFAMIGEIRRQFREIPGLLEGRGTPDHAGCVDIATAASLRRMVLPGAVAVVTPVAVGFVAGPAALGGLLAGALVAGVLLGILMANAGGAWDNAKKLVERGEHGGKGSPVHAATVVGDTVGDPLKDTAGPSLNILIKLMAIVSLTLAPLLV